MPTINLVRSNIEKLKPPLAGRDLYRDKSMRTFALELLASGKATWYRMGRIFGQVTRMKLGDYPDLSPELARGLCMEANADISRGVDPRQKKQKQTKTLGDVWEWYLEHHAKPRKRTWRRDESVWNRSLCRWAKKPLTDIDRSMIVELQTTLRVKRGHAATGHRIGGPAAANEMLGLLRGLYDVANVNGWHQGNPAALVQKDRIQKRDRFLQPKELPKFFQELEACKPIARDIFKLALFTGVRRSNVCAARWEQINWESATWVVPYDESKTGEPIDIPLIPAALEIFVNRTGNGSEWVFPSHLSKTGHYVNPKTSWEMLCQRCGVKNLHIHDLRRTLASWQAGAGVSLHIIAESLGHKGTSSTGVYARLQKSTVRASVENAMNLILEASVVKKIENDGK